MRRTAVQILESILQGEEITVGEANILMAPELAKLEDIMSAAHYLTRQAFGKELQMCAIYPAKVGRCSGDCAFCAQSVHHTCAIEPIHVNDLDKMEIIDNAKKLRQAGVRQYSLVTSGESLTNTEFDIILQILQGLKTGTDMGICVSLGKLTLERAKKLKKAGVSRYHHNIETCRSYFPQICSTHSYDDKLNTIKIVKQVGMELCCGGIIALGETKEQRVEMAFELKEIDMEGVPINILNAIQGTRLESQKPLSVDEILRTIAVFRLILPKKVLRIAGGREKALGEEEYRIYEAGINALLAGNYLTTSGKSAEQEKDNLRQVGYCIDIG